MNDNRNKKHTIQGKCVLWHICWRALLFAMLFFSSHSFGMPFIAVVSFGFVNAEVTPNGHFAITEDFGNPMQTDFSTATFRLLHW